MLRRTRSCATIWASLLLISVYISTSVQSDDDDGQCRPPTEHHDFDEGFPYRIPGQIIDITKELGPSTMNWESEHGLGEFRERYTRIEKGDPANQSKINLPVHTATHVDSPGHWLHDHYETGLGTEALDLHKLNGPVLVVEVEYDSNITANVLDHLSIPEGIHRIIFRTQNTHRGLMHQTPFISDYTSLTKDGAEWIVNNTAIELIGIDYTSIAIYEDLPGPHYVLLEKEIIPVEGLVLDDVLPGIYELSCLPLKLVGSDGAPARCILKT